MLDVVDETMEEIELDGFCLTKRVDVLCVFLGVLLELKEQKKLFTLILTIYLRTDEKELPDRGVSSINLE